MELLINFLIKCLPCFPSLQNPTVNVNGVKFCIKIICPYGSHDATFANAMREVNNYNRFSVAKSPFVVESIDAAILSEPNGAKTFYILLPYFEKSLQDVINYNILNNVVMDERELVGIFIGVLRGVRVLHKFKNIRNTDAGANGFENDLDTLLLGDLEMRTSPSSSTELQELCAYAHRDIKPANIMLSSDGFPVLVDFGSCQKARISVNTRQQGLTLTDFALEHCTLPYRAPELLNVAIKDEITEATDIWSLGCVLYTCCFGFSPFEKMELDQGASLNLAISRAQYAIPKDTKGYSKELMDMIRQCLKLDPSERPDVDELLDLSLRLVPN